MNVGSRRLLAAALLASIALHLLILALPVLREARDTLFAAPPIQARLVEPAPPAPVAAPQAPRTEPRSEPKVTPKRAAPRPEPAVKPAPVAPAPSPSPAATAPEQPAEKVEAKPAPAAPAASAPASASPTPAGSGQEMLTVDQYRLTLIGAMRRDQVYPRLARENGWEGRVTLRIVINPAGAIGALEVRSSTGYEVLDRRALEMVRNAQAQTPVPAALRGRELAFEVPVIFSLKDAR